MSRGTTPTGSNVYSAVWDNRPDPVTVELEEWAAALSGRTFTVSLRDSNGKVVRDGVVQCGAWREPYCLVEIRTDSPLLPDAYHGRWILGVAFSSNRRKFEAAVPLRWSWHFKYDPEDSHFNYLSVEPVKWGNDHETIRTGYGIFAYDDPPEIRFAEKIMGQANLSD